MHDPSKVFIVGGNAAYDRMFIKQGWTVTSQIKGADLVQFCGGEDVTPALYGEAKHPETSCNPDRDKREEIIFGLALKAKIPMAGICRGGQFLNVMCGGKMWQHVDGHALGGTHECHDLTTGDVFQVTSTHHQMMRVGEGGRIIAVAKGVSTCKEHMNDQRLHAVMCRKTGMDAEAVWYPAKKCFCFQPHPEFLGQDRLAARYFEYLYEYLEVI